jgi:hypothetical protein
MSTISDPYLSEGIHQPDGEHLRGLDVLQFGGEYIHCGEPMHAAGSELRSIYSPVSTESATEGLLEVYLSTRVLRCDCGFQMEIPE